jgi:hypothetical protein
MRRWRAKRWWLVNYDTLEVIAGPFRTSFGADHRRFRLISRWRTDGGANADVRQLVGAWASGTPTLGQVLRSRPMHGSDLEGIWT